jgi:hypothetical protein
MGVGLKLRLMKRVEKITGISMRIRYKNQEPLSLSMKLEWAGISDFPFKLITSYEIMHSPCPTSHQTNSDVKRQIC